MDKEDIKQRLIKLYNEGKSRKEAMEACGLDRMLDNGRMAGLSKRLDLQWSLPPEKRANRAEPAPDRTLVPPDPKHSAPFAPNPEASEVDTTCGQGRLKPSPGFISARQRRLRGIKDSRFLPPGLRDDGDEAERYLNRYYEDKYA